MRCKRRMRNDKSQRDTKEKNKSMQLKKDDGLCKKEGEKEVKGRS